MPEEDLLTRNVPNEDTMQPLLKGWAKALRSMPSLREATLSFKVEVPDSRTNDEEDLCMIDWEDIYESPSIYHHGWEKQLQDEERFNRRLIFHNTRGWRPNRDAMDLLQHVGDDSHLGTKLVVLAINEWSEISR